MRNNSLVCAGANNEQAVRTFQEIIQNVHEFKVSYYIQQNASTGAPSIKKVNAAGVSVWSDVFAIEVCLDMVGNPSNRSSQQPQIQGLLQIMTNLMAIALIKFFGTYSKFAAKESFGTT